MRLSYSEQFNCVKVVKTLMEQNSVIILTSGHFFKNHVAMFLSISVFYQMGIVICAS